MVDGFDIVETVNGTTLWVDSDRLEACLSYYKERNIGTLGINPQRGYLLTNLNFLRDAPLIRKLVIVSSPRYAFDYSPIAFITSLESLTVDTAISLSLNTLPNLASFRGFWNPSMDLCDCSALRNVALSGFKPKSKHIKDLKIPNSVVTVELVQSNVETLDGIARFSELEMLELAYLSKLADLKGVKSLENLTVLDLQKCPHVNCVDELRGMSNIKILRLNACGELKNLNFINDLPGLEEFRFVNTNVIDGNLAPLLRLKRVGFLSKKHFSHKPDQFIALA